MPISPLLALLAISLSGTSADLCKLTWKRPVREIFPLKLSGTIEVSKEAEYAFIITQTWQGTCPTLKISSCGEIVTIENLSSENTASPNTGDCENVVLEDDEDNNEDN